MRNTVLQRLLLTMHVLQRCVFISQELHRFCSHRTHYSIISSHRPVIALCIRFTTSTAIYVYIARTKELFFTSNALRCRVFSSKYYSVVCSHRTYYSVIFFTPNVSQCVHTNNYSALCSQSTYYCAFCSHRTITALFVHIAPLQRVLFIPHVLQGSLFTSHYYSALCSHRTITARFVHTALLQRSLFTSHYYSALFTSHYYCAICSHRTYYRTLCSHRTITAPFVHIARITVLFVDTARV